MPGRSDAGTRWRLFVALNLAPAERARLFRATASLRAGQVPVRWVTEDNLHLTLQFLGPVQAERVRGIETALRDLAVACRPFEIEVSGVGGFPNLRRARVVWMGVTAGPELDGLHEAVGRALAPLGFEAESRPFRPHVTLGRSRDRGRGPDLTPAAETVDYRARVGVDSVDLMRSHLSRAGARYECVARCALGYG